MSHKSPDAPSVRCSKAWVGARHALGHIVVVVLLQTTPSPTHFPSSGSGREASPTHALGGHSEASRGIKSIKASTRSSQVLPSTPASPAAAMVKLTPELIQQSSQHINPLRDRELSLRGYKIPVIENLGATLDQFDIVDFSDNDIRKLDGFPLLKRLKTLLLNNNRIVRISDTLSESLPNLQSLFLTNNLVQELADLDSLAGLKKLEYVSLLGNPVTTRDHYRLYLINKVPQVRVVDFRRVRLQEREMAKKLFKSKLGKEIQKEAKKARTFVPGSTGTPGTTTDTRPPLAQMSSEDQAAIRQAIGNARSMEEVERLQHMLRTGNIPSRSQPSKRRYPDEEEEN